jgi:hypothetical protein
MLYDDQVIPVIHRYAGGVPRLINTICDNCLFEAYLCKMDRVDNRIAHSVAGDLGLLQQPLSEIPRDRVKEDLDEIEAMLERLEQRH